MVVAKEKGTDFKPAPQGTHIARCVQSIDLGSQYNKKWRKTNKIVVLGWELPNCMQEATSETPERPYIVWNRYTASLSEKSWLRRHLEAWRGKEFTREELQGFDTSNVLDVPCMLNIIHKEYEGSTFANIAAVMAVPKGTEVPDRISYLIDFNIAEPWDETTFANFREKLQNTIKESEEYKQLHNVYQEDMKDDEPEADQEEESDIPFAWLLPWLIPLSLTTPVLGVSNAVQAML